MSEQIRLEDLTIFVQRRAVKHVYLRVHPPDGRVTIVAPTGTRLEVVRDFVIAKLGWIRKQQAKLQSQIREVPRQFIEHENHTLWG